MFIYKYTQDTMPSFLNAENIELYGHVFGGRNFPKSQRYQPHPIHPHPTPLKNQKKNPNKKWYKYYMYM